MPLLDLWIERRIKPLLVELNEHLVIWQSGNLRMRSQTYPGPMTDITSEVIAGIKAEIVTYEVLVARHSMR